MPDPILRLEGVSLRFHPDTPNEVTSLNSVNLELEPGGLTVVLGSNGSGKSSLLGAIAGSLAPTEGRIFLGKEEITRWPEDRRARQIGRVFQHPLSGTAPELTIAEHLVLAARRGARHGLGSALAPTRLQPIRAQVARLGMGLEDRLDTPVGSLSGGQRQALTVLMATMTRPALLLLDEHTAALDPRSAEVVIRLTRELVAAGGLTTLMVTHSLGEAVEVGDRILVMNRGRVAADFHDTGGQRLGVEDLLQVFDQLRWADRLDSSAAEMLRLGYA
jgi:putative ABC transport system ATP-binding protein